MDDQHIDELLPGFAIGSLDPEDQREVLRHLAGCRRCQSELLAYQEVVELLPYAVKEVNPANSLRAAVLGAARSETGDPVDHAAVPWWSGIEAFLRKNAFAWGLSSLALVLLFAISTMILWGQLQAQSYPTSMQVFVLQATELNPQAEAVLVLDRAGVEGNLTVDGLPELPDNLEYQLWLIDGERRTDAGVFSVDEEGYGKLHIDVPEGLGTYTSLGITIEPAGGSPGPTGDKVMGLDL